MEVRKGICAIMGFLTLGQGKKRFILIWKGRKCLLSSFIKATMLPCEEVNDTGLLSINSPPTFLLRAEALDLTVCG